MKELDYLSAIILGIIQGATEFLPVSSSGHLAISQHMMQFDAESPAMLLFDVLAHLGTLLAVMIVFTPSIAKFTKSLIAESRPGYTGRRNAWLITLLGIAAFIPTAAIALPFKDQFKEAFGNTRLIGVCLIVTGFLLVGSTMVSRGRRGWRKFSWWRAAIVGIAQACAILPGISRSGTTICVASYLGLRRRWAGEYSFFIAFPAILGASAIQIKDTLKLGETQVASIQLGPVLVGSFVSFIVGVFALKALLGVVRRAKLHYFAVYCWALGIVLLIGLDKVLALAGFSRAAS